jgi:hypothetical protein
MARYAFGQEKARRKNTVLPCVIGERFENMTPGEQVRTLRETYWADYITETEWKAILGQLDKTYTGVVRSRLKKKVIAWWILLGRIAILDPKLYNDSVQQAIDLYLRQTETPHPIFMEPR